MEPLRAISPSLCAFSGVSPEARQTLRQIRDRLIVLASQTRTREGIEHCANLSEQILDEADALTSWLRKTCMADRVESWLTPLPPAPQERIESRESRSPDGDGLGVPRRLASERPAQNKPSVAQQHTGHDNRAAGSEPADSLQSHSVSAPLPPAAPQAPTAEEQSWADLRADGGLPEAPREASALFVPLNAEYFEAFANGSKRDELRRYGPRWNEQTCAVGRRVVLSKGYGKAHRLTGRVASFKKQHGATFGSTYKASIERIFGTLDLYIACIGIELSAPPAAGLPPPRPAGSVE